MILLMKKERVWRKSRNICRKTQRTNINNFRRQKQVDQGEKQKVRVLGASIQLWG